jgi:hypothetical protein
MQEHQDEVLKVLRDNGMIAKRESEETRGGNPLAQKQGTQKGPKPAMPKEFDGSRATGRAFLNSVKWYLRSRGHEFRDLDQMISWTLSFMKEGRALTFANQITRQTDKEGIIPYQSWALFWKELENRFLPIDEAEEAINTLETDKYFQGKQTVDDYCDKFLDLVDHAGYNEGRQVVMKFRKGLDSEIADRVAMLQEKRPEDDDIKEWVRMAKEVARQRIRNEAFNQVVRRDKTNASAPVKAGSFFRLAPAVGTKLDPPIPNPRPFAATRPFQPPPPPPLPKPATTGPIPMEVDASYNRNRVPVTCHRCGQPGHFRNQCPKRFDVRFMTTEEIDDHVQNQVLQKDIAALNIAETDTSSEQKETDGIEEEGFGNGLE